MRQVRPSARAFTLIELLVVIAILALLLTFLMPTLQRARELARRTICQSNFHAMGVGAHGFASEHDGRGPGCTGRWQDWGGYAGPSWPTILNIEYYHSERIAEVCWFTGPYSKNKLVCPSVLRWRNPYEYMYWVLINHHAHGGECSRPISSDNPYFFGKIVPAPYGFEDYGALDYHLGARLEQFPQPSWQMLLMEGENFGMYYLRPSHAVEVLPVGAEPDRAPYCGPEGHHAYRHLLTSTFTYIDGHVQSLGPRDQLNLLSRYAFR